MKLLLLTLGFGAVSAVIPIFNMEAYVTVVWARTPDQTTWGALVLASAGSLGQNLGKLVWYYVCRGALDIPWMQRRIDTPKRQETFERWRGVVQGRPVFSGGLNFVSATFGFPPFFAMAMVAGTLRMNVVVFFVTGLIGRTLFFWAWLLGVGLIFG